MLMPLSIWRAVSNPAIVAVVLQATEQDIGIMDYSIPVVIAAPVVLALAGAIRVQYKANQNMQQWMRDQLDRRWDEEVRRARGA